MGSVFSPYYAFARRRGRGDPLAHCALNVALYGEKRKYWSMTERRRAAIRRTAHEFAVGPSCVEWDGTALTFRIDEVTCPLPSRLKGTVRVFPAGLNKESFAIDAAGHHIWRPIAPCARVEVDFRNPALRWSGNGYFDTNYGDRPLENDFRSWQWSRATTNKGTAVSYDTAARGRDGGASLALLFDASGAVTRLDPISLAETQLAPTGWRIARTARSDPRSSVTVQRTLEDAPFYARSQLSARLFGEPVELIHESLSLDRFRMPVVQAMLPFRMPRW